MSDMQNPVAEPSRQATASPSRRVRIAVLMTCHNRRERTLACLASLERQEDIPEVDLRLVLVDDGSTDGTGAAVAARVPGARVVQGNGSLYWCGGMRVAVRAAMEDAGAADAGPVSPGASPRPLPAHWSAFPAREADYHLWLNDDVVLEPRALRTLLDAAESLRRGHPASPDLPGRLQELPIARNREQARRPHHNERQSCGAGVPPAFRTTGSSRGSLSRAAIVTGSCRDPRTGVHTYGGVRRRSQWPPLRFALIPPAADRPARCETVHGNVLLVPREAFLALGNLDEGFVHMVGDFDYGLRAGQLGIRCWIAPGFVAYCARHAVRGTMHDATLPLRQRLALARRPTGRTSAREWMRFTRRHTGWRWPLFWAETLVSRELLLWLWLWLAGRRPEEE